MLGQLLAEQAASTCCNGVVTANLMPTSWPFPSVSVLDQSDRLSEITLYDGSKRSDTSMSQVVGNGSMRLGPRQRVNPMIMLWHASGFRPLRTAAGRRI
jgi:hypothetical protein